MEEKIGSDLIRGHIDTIILHALIKEDKYAQQISATISEKSNKKYEINQATLYSSLKRLESLKYVNSYWHDASDGRRKFFAITDLGKDFVNTNLENWSFSRSVIDDLMDCHTENVKSEVFFVNSSPAKEKITENITNTEEKNDNIEKNDVKDEYTVQEDSKINFRNVLNDLIKNGEDSKLNENDNNSNKYAKKEIEQINSVQFDAKNNKNANEIDYTDLLEKADNEGYKLLISSNGPAEIKGKILINKINLFSSLISLFIGLLGTLIVGLIFKKDVDISFIKVFITVVAFSVLPAVCLIKYLATPNENRSSLYNDELLKVSIIIINLILITFAIFFIGFDFSDKVDLVSFLILPIGIFIYAFSYFCARKLFSTVKSFKS